MDEIDAIGGRRFSEGTSADREIQRTLMELLNQLDGFDQLGKVFICYLCYLWKLLLECNHHWWELYGLLAWIYIDVIWNVTAGQNDNGN